MSEFELLRGAAEGRLFVKIRTETCHLMIEVNESELADLRDSLSEPRPFRR